MGQRDKSTEQVCELLDIDPSTLKRWVAAGCPCDKGGKGKARSFSESEVAAWMKAHNKTGKPGRPTGPLSEELARARIRKESALAHKYEMECAEQEGQLLRRSEVERQNVEKVAALRNGLLALPATLAPALEGHDAAEIEQRLERAVVELLEAFSKG